MGVVLLFKELDFLLEESYFCLQTGTKRGTTEEHLPVPPYTQKSALLSISDVL